MMIISKMMGKAHARESAVKTIQELAKLIVSTDYSLGTFKDGHRTVENFVQAEAIALDFDSGLTLDEAKRAFEPYRHIIATTRSHQLDKGGVVCDRFRVVLFLSRPITDAETYYATWYSLKKLFPACDDACKDPARFFYKSKTIESMNIDGKLIDPVAPQPKPELKVVTPLPEGEYGKLAKRTLEFLTVGAPKGKKHNELYAAARDAHQQGYTKEWFMSQMKRLSEINSDPDYTDKGSVKTIEDAFVKEPRHAPRVEQKAFTLMNMDELLAKKVQVEWVVDRMLTTGGMTIVAGPPKSGKSTLVRQLAVNVLRGTPFLGRSVKQGSVLYLALEEQLETLQEDFVRLGGRPGDNFRIHIGAPEAATAMEELNQLLTADRPTLCVVDTLFLFAPVKSEKEYSEVNAVLARIRKIARASGTHIVLLHHSRKANKDEKRIGARSILGSTAIHGAVDCAIIIEQENNQRIISTSQRVGRRIDHTLLVFDEATHTVSLGAELEDVF